MKLHFEIHITRLDKKDSYIYPGSDREELLRKARTKIKNEGGEWSIRVDKYRKGELIDSRKLKR